MVALIKQLAKLNEGVKIWNEWRTQLPDDLAVDLVRANFGSENLSGVDFNRADLYYTNFRSADLSGADLRIARLSGTNFRGANLKRANLVGANLSGADLSGADLSGTNFGATIFADTNLTDVTGLEHAIHRAPSTLDHLTLVQSGRLPLNFLRECGLPESLIDYLPSLLNQPISFYSCFISYSHADKVFARRLHDQLQGRGIRCWLDEHQLLPGDDIYERVDQGIKLWDKVLLCASKDALTSWWVDNEIDAAFIKEQQLMKQRGQKVWSLIPLNLDGYLFSGKWERGTAGQVKTRLAADFTGWATDNDKFEQAFEHVVKALKTDDAGREPAPVLKL